MYYVLEANRKLKKIRHLNYENGEGWGIDFLKGRVVEQKSIAGDLVVRFECARTELPDFFEVEGAIPIVNEKVINVLNSVRAVNFQAFPLKIQFENGVVEGYFLLNITSRLRRIDMNTTKCKKWGPSIMRIFDLKLKTETEEGAVLYRDHAYQMVIFISESVTNAIESADISGCELRKADGWNDAHRF